MPLSWSADHDRPARPRPRHRGQHGDLVVGARRRRARPGARPSGFLRSGFSTGADRAASGATACVPAGFWAALVQAVSTAARVAAVAADQLADPEDQGERQRGRRRRGVPSRRVGQPPARVRHRCHGRHGSQHRDPIVEQRRGTRRAAWTSGAADMSDLHTPVLSWYADHARELPWRRPEATPWAVMVSEFMLQQTPVARVLPVFDTWLTTWPTPGALAAAPSGRGGARLGPAGLPAPGPAAARRRDARSSSGTAARCPASYARPDGAARRRRLHRERDRVLRLRPPARGAGHQRAPGARPRGRRGRVPRHRRSPGRARRRRVAACPTTSRPPGRSR